MRRRRPAAREIGQIVCFPGTDGALFRRKKLLNQKESQQSDVDEVSPAGASTGPAIEEERVQHLAPPSPFLLDGLNRSESPERNPVQPQPDTIVQVQPEEVIEYVLLDQEDQVNASDGKEVNEDQPLPSSELLILPIKPTESENAFEGQPNSPAGISIVALSFAMDDKDPLPQGPGPPEKDEGGIRGLPTLFGVPTGRGDRQL